MGIDNFQADNESSTAELRRSYEKKSLQAFEASTQGRTSIRKIVFDLSVAVSINKPREVEFPFKSVYVQDATDSNTEISMRVDKRDDDQDFFKLRQSETFSWDRTRSKSFFHWPAQPGKSMTILFGVDVEIRSGKQVNVLSGGVLISDGSQLTSLPKVSANGTPAIVAAQNTDRTCIRFQNQGAQTVYFGGAAVTGQFGANPGIAVGPGESIQFRNSADIWACTDAIANNNIAVIEEEA